MGVLKGRKVKQSRGPAVLRGLSASKVSKLDLEAPPPIAMLTTVPFTVAKIQGELQCSGDSEWIN